MSVFHPKIYAQLVRVYLSWLVCSILTVMRYIADTSDLVSHFLNIRLHLRFGHVTSRRKHSQIKNHGYKASQKYSHYLLKQIGSYLSVIDWFKPSSISSIVRLSIIYNCPSHPEYNNNTQAYSRKRHSGEPAPPSYIILYDHHCKTKCTCSRDTC